MPSATQTQDEGKQGSPVDEPGSVDGADDAKTTKQPLLGDGGNGEYLRKMIMKWDIKIIK